MANYLQYVSCQNMCSLIMWPFQNEKNFFNFTIPTISYIAAQRFSNYVYATSSYYSAGAFITASAAFIAFQICKCLDRNLSNLDDSKTVKKPKPIFAESGATLSAHLDRTPLVEKVKRHLNNTKRIFKIVNSIFLDEIFIPLFDETSFVLTKDQNDVLEMSQFFYISLERLNEISKIDNINERYYQFLMQLDKKTLDFLDSNGLYEDFIPEGFSDYLEKKIK